jgi:hypothetical protein
MQRCRSCKPRFQRYSIMMHFYLSNVKKNGFWDLDMENVDLSV